MKSQYSVMFGKAAHFGFPTYVSITHRLTEIPCRYFRTTRTWCVDRAAVPIIEVLMKRYYAPGSCELAPQIALRGPGQAFDLVAVDFKLLCLSIPAWRCTMRAARRVIRRSR